MIGKFLLLVLAFAAGTPAYSGGYPARNGLIVIPREDGTLFVPYGGLAGARDFWCAAGDYVVNRLHLPPATRIWRLSPPPRRSGEGIAFSLSREGAAPSGLALASRDGGLSAAHALLFCRKRLRWF